MVVHPKRWQATSTRAVESERAREGGRRVEVALWRSLLQELLLPLRNLGGGCVARFGSAFYSCCCRCALKTPKLTSKVCIERRLIPRCPCPVPRSRSLSIIPIVSDNALLELLDRFLDRWQWGPGTIRASTCAEEAFQFQVQSRTAEELVKQGFEPLPVDIRQSEGRHDFHVRQQVGRIVLRVGHPAFHVSSGHPNLVNH